MANTKATFVAVVTTVVRFLAKPSHFFAFFDSLVAVTARLSALKSRSGHFRVDNDVEGQTDNDYLTPCACVRGNKVHILVILL